MNIQMIIGLIMSLIGGLCLMGSNSRFVSILGMFVFAIGIILGIKGRRKFDEDKNK